MPGSIMPAVYHIRVRGHLDPTWSEWLNGLDITNQPDDMTIITGLFQDQAELIGVLIKIHSLDLALVSVHLTDDPI